MSKPFQFSKRTIPYAFGWLILAVVTGWLGVLALDYNLTAAVFGLVLAFNCFWAAIDSLRGIPLARIALNRAVLVIVMMMAYWFLISVTPSNMDPAVG